MYIQIYIYTYNNELKLKSLNTNLAILAILLKCGSYQEVGIPINRFYGDMIFRSSNTLMATYDY